MTIQKEEIKNQNIEEKKEIAQVVEQQKNQLDTVKSNTAKTVDHIDNTNNQYQKNNNDSIQTNIKATNKLADQTLETFQYISENYLEIQNNIYKLYESTFSKIANNISNDYWKNFIVPGRYSNVYNETNKRISDTSINTGKIINEIAVEYSEFFNKTMEIGQKYYNESVKSYLDFINKIERSY